MKIKITYLGGPTYLLEIGRFRFLTDPAFDQQGNVPVAEIGGIDVVLLSHEQHYDNLSDFGRSLLPRAGRVLTTPESAAALGGNAEGLTTWATVELTSSEGEKVRVTAMPAVHGTTEELRRATGETTGFLLEWPGQQNGPLYISGDTVWHDGIEEIGKRFKVGTAILHMGAVRASVAGSDRLTMNGEEGARVTQKLGACTVFPSHFEGWEHYTEGRDEIEQAFLQADLSDRLNFLESGQTVEVVV